MKLQDPNTEPPVGIWPSDIGSLAFALDEFFDVLDVVYLKGDGMRPSLPLDDGLRSGRRKNPNASLLRQR